MRRAWVGAGAAACVAASLTLPIAHAAPAKPPKPVTTVTVTGRTVITLDDSTAAQLDAQGVRLVARPPATGKRDSITLPVSQVTESAVRHRGGLVLVGPTRGKVTADDLVLRIGAGDASATLTFTTLLQRIDLLRSSDISTKTLPPRSTTKGRVTTTVRTTTISGPVRLIDDPALVLMLNGALGAYALTPGQSMGTFATTLVETTTVVRPKP